MRLATPAGVLPMTQVLPAAFGPDQLARAEAEPASPSRSSIAP
jgi:hypothetical protein